MVSDGSSSHLWLGSALYGAYRGLSEERPKSAGGPRALERS